MQLFKVKTKYYVYAMLGIALLLRLFNLNFAGLWNDELFTASSAHPRMSIIEVINFLKMDIHPPLHNILCNIWSKLFSYNDTSLRVLNILIGVFGVYSVYVLAKLLFNKKIGLYAMVFAVLNSYLIMYSQEVRSYGLLFLLANYSFYFFIKLIRNGFTVKNAGWYILVTTAMLYTHYFALFVIASQFFCFLLLIDWRYFKKKAYKYIITFALPNLLFLFWLPIILKHLDKERGGWRNEANISLLFKYPQDFFNDHILSIVSVCLVIITFLYLVSRKFIKNKQLSGFFNNSNYGLVILITWFSVFFFIPYLKSSFSSTMMFNRYFLPLITPLIILLAFYLSKINSKKIRNGVLVSVIAYSLLILFLNDNPYFSRTTTYREIVEHLKEEDNDAYVLHIARSWRYFDYYLRQNNFKNFRKEYQPFKNIIESAKPQEYYVLLNLRQIPKKYQKRIPVIDGYKKVKFKTFKNSYSVSGTQLIKYSKQKDTLKASK